VNADRARDDEQTTSASPLGDGNSRQEIFDKNKRIIAAELRTRVIWFITLRWFVPFSIAGVGLAAWFAGFEFNLTAILSTAVLVLSYNLICFFISRSVDLDPRRPDRLYTFSYIQIALDYFALFLLVYFSGGAASPIIFIFIFHIIFGSILLPAKSAYGFAAVAVLGMWSMAFGEMAGAIPHQMLSFRGDTIGLLDKPWYLIVLLVFFSGAIVTTAISITVVMRVLKRRIIENAEYYEQIDNLIRERWRFMRKVAHNLRAPLVAVISMLDMIRNGYLGAVAGEQAEYLRRINRRARHMAGMISELMEIARSRTKTGLPSPHPITVPKIAARVSRTFMDEAVQKGLTLLVETEDSLNTVFVDLELAESILENLISNAIKYTEKGSVRVTFSEAEQGMIEIAVSDTGIGIPEEEQGNLFHEFFRAHNARAVEEVGTGLGLALIKETLDKNNGRIELESRQNEGTTFRVFIPTSEAETEPEKT
jgi:signal transduction histidine kinase